jgi:hypothetical protein
MHFPVPVQFMYEFAQAPAAVQIRFATPVFASTKTSAQDVGSSQWTPVSPVPLAISVAPPQLLGPVQ